MLRLCSPVVPVVHSVIARFNASFVAHFVHQPGQDGVVNCLGGNSVLPVLRSIGGRTRGNRWGRWVDRMLHWNSFGSNRWHQARAVIARGTSVVRSHHGCKSYYNLLINNYIYIFLFHKPLIYKDSIFHFRSGVPRGDQLGKFAAQAGDGCRREPAPELYARHRRSKCIIRGGRHRLPFRPRLKRHEFP